MVSDGDFAIGNYFKYTKNIWCFYIWLIGDILWCTFDFTQGMYGRSVLDFIQIILAICGIVSWKKDNKTCGGV